MAQPTLREQVYEVVRLVPSGRVVAYGDIAELLGMSARMVGRCMALNDQPGLPWWRVVNRQGRLPVGLLPEALAHWAEEETPVGPEDLVRMTLALADLADLADAAEERLGPLPGASGWGGDAVVESQPR